MEVKSSTAPGAATYTALAKTATKARENFIMNEMCVCVGGWVCVEKGIFASFGIKRCYESHKSFSERRNEWLVKSVVLLLLL